MGVFDNCMAACSKTAKKDEELVMQHSEEEEEEDDDDEQDDEEFEKRLQAMSSKLQGARASVSAESYGKWNQKTDYKPPVYEKSEAVKTRIMAALNRSFLFKPLDDNDKNVVCMAFKEHHVKKGDVVIKQGSDVTPDEPGLYMLEKGEIAAYKKKPDDKDSASHGAKVYTYTNAGESFGELALLYNAPRAASVIAESDAVLWSINRDTFNATVKTAAQKKRERYSKFLRSVDLLKDLDQFEIDKVSDAITSHKFQKGTKVISEGDLGREFYMLETGTCEAKKGGDTVMTYKAGQYFGELALMKKAPRAATVIATTDVEALSLEEEAFRRLLGPLEALMKKKAKGLYDMSMD